jgi:hypothetical protein
MSVTDPPPQPAATATTAINSKIRARIVMDASPCTTNSTRAYRAAGSEYGGEPYFNRRSASAFPARKENDGDPYGCRHHNPDSKGPNARVV